MNPAAVQRKSSRLDAGSKGTRKFDWGEVVGPVLCLLPVVYGVAAFGGVRPIDQAAILACCSMGIAFWTWRLHRTGQLAFDSVLLFFLPFCVYGIWWYYGATVKYTARIEILDVWAGTILFLLSWYFIRSARQRQLALYTLTGIAAIAALWGVIQTYTGKTNIWGMHRPLQYGQRGSGPYINPNHLAGLIELVLPMALAYIALAKSGAASKLVLGYAAVAMIAGLVSTQSRAGVASCATSGIFLLGFLATQKRSRFIALFILTTLLVAGLAGLLRNDQLKKRFHKVALIVARQDDEARLKFWPAAWHIWQTSPWLGVGPNHFDFYYPQVGSPYYQSHPVRVHNDYLNTLVDWGSVGLTLVMLALSVLVVLGVRHLWRCRNLPPQNEAGEFEKLAWVTGTLFALLGIGIHSLADFNMHIRANADLVCLLSGAMLAAIGQQAGRRRTVDQSRKVLLTICLTPVALIIAWWSWFLFQESQMLGKAKSAPYGSKLYLARLQSASSFNPDNYQTLFDLAECYRLQGVYATSDIETPLRKAIQYYEQTLTANRFAWEAHAKIGMCHSMLGEFELAEKSFKRAFQLNVYSARLMAFYGWHCVQMKRYSEAENWFHKAQFYTKNQNELSKFYLDWIARSRRDGTIH